MSERVAKRWPGLELGAQPLEVVDLAVEDDPDGAVLVVDRLVAAGEVDDREPAHPERGAVPREPALPVGPAMHDRGQHPLDAGVARGRRRLAPDAADAAHQEAVPASRGVAVTVRELSSRSQRAERAQRDVDRAEIATKA